MGAVIRERKFCNSNYISSLVDTRSVSMFVRGTSADRANVKAKCTHYTFKISLKELSSFFKVREREVSGDTSRTDCNLETNETK